MALQFVFLCQLKYVIKRQSALKRLEGNNVPILQYDYFFVGKFFWSPAQILLGKYSPC